MTQHGPEHHEVPHDLALKEAFDAFIHQPQVPVDFHARVMGRVHQQRARRRLWGGVGKMVDVVDASLVAPKSLGGDGLWAAFPCSQCRLGLLRVET